MSNVRNVPMSQIIFDVPMQRTLINNKVNINKNNTIQKGNTGTFGKLQRWKVWRNTKVKNNYEPVSLIRSRQFPNYYIIENGRHRIAKLYSEGKRSVRAKIKNKVK